MIGALTVFGEADFVDPGYSDIYSRVSISNAHPGSLMGRSYFLFSLDIDLSCCGGGITANSALNANRLSISQFSYKSHVNQCSPLKSLFYGYLYLCQCTMLNANASQMFPPLAGYTISSASSSH